MFIRIRKENFGYVLFDRFNRTHHFVRTRDTLGDKTEREIATFLGQYFSPPDDNFNWEFIQPPENNLELSAPIGLYLEISPFCNLRCAHCYKPAQGTNEPLTTGQIMQLIDELANIGVFEIRLCGNEPTANPNFFEICRHIQSKNMYLGINTNAYFGDGFRERLMSLRPDFVVVSIDGTQEIHDLIRKQGSYQKAILLLEALSQTSIKKRINTVLSRATLNTIPHIANLCQTYGADASFLPLRPVGQATGFKQTNSLTPALMQQAVKKVMMVRGKFPKTTFLTYFDLYAKTPTYHHSMEFNQPCPARKNGFVSSEGDFFPCDFQRALGDRFLCGNVAREGFWKTWSESTVLRNYQNIRLPKCQTCNYYLKTCNGGCTASSFASGDSCHDELCFKDLIQIENASH